MTRRNEVQQHDMQTAYREAGFALCYVRQIASRLVQNATGDVLQLIDEARSALDELETTLLLGGMV